MNSSPVPSTKTGNRLSKRFPVLFLLSQRFHAPHGLRIICKLCGKNAGHAQQICTRIAHGKHSPRPEGRGECFYSASILRMTLLYTRALTTWSVSINSSMTAHALLWSLPEIVLRKSLSPYSAMTEAGAKEYAASSGRAVSFGALLSQISSATIMAW